ncbi:MAG: ferrous iron transport protein B [Cytophagales bacterium]|nr:ferrous iron transport protein B [Cytophagales bacterium]MDW8384970.1 ferrous iron transport protein B [Flammeovirgaceae bacterium]
MKKIAIIGNPNSGKTSIFNHLTGLRQQTGNFAGVTVEIHKAAIIFENQPIEIIDFPGTYSLFPNAADERLVVEILLDEQHAVHPDIVCYIASAQHLERHLLLFSQIQDLGFLTVLGITMLDTAEQQGITVDLPKLQQLVGVPVVSLNGRSGKGTQELLKNIKNASCQTWIRSCEEQKQFLKQQLCENFTSVKPQIEDVLQRYQRIQSIVDECTAKKMASKTFTERLDTILIHPIGGLLIFLGLMFFLFQAIFSWAEIPMNWIEEGFVWVSLYLKGLLSEGWFANLLTDGILAGLSGIVVFIPQIAILSAFIALLEESGYMARAIFLTDNIMRRFGLNGRSLVSLISGTACAIPAIIATRNISNQKERLITILVTPFMSCSARLPVFTLLISVGIPSEKVGGILDARGLILFALYLAGATTALLASKILSQIIPTSERNVFMLELPVYQYPHWKSILLTVYNKVRTFVWEAGKIILIISVILWALAFYGPTYQRQKAEQLLQEQMTSHTDNVEQLRSSIYLETSYIGMLGKFIEPIIEPLGFDWKIGIALITSFAAREVFVATMATLYSVVDAEDTRTLVQRVKAEINPKTGQPVFTFPVVISLLIFYLFAMQCASTLAVVRRETHTWKWAILQLLAMSGWAYVASWLAYRIAVFWV